MEGVLTVLLVAGLGLAIHTAPMSQQTPCEPGFFAEVQAMIIPSAEASGSCAGYCDTQGSSGCHLGRG